MPGHLYAGEVSRSASDAGSKPRAHVLPAHMLPSDELSARTVLRYSRPVAQQFRSTSLMQRRVANVSTQHADTVLLKKSAVHPALVAMVPALDVAGEQTIPERSCVALSPPNFHPQCSTTFFRCRDVTANMESPKSVVGP